MNPGITFGETWADLLHAQLLKAGHGRGAAWQAVTAALEEEVRRVPGRVDALIGERQFRCPEFVIETLVELGAEVRVKPEQLGLFR